MQYPDDNMDELFRKAAENYPLNTNMSDWSKVQGMLAPDESNISKRNDKRHLLWLLLLLPLFFICNRIVTPGNDTASISKNTAKGEAVKQAQPQTATDVAIDQAKTSSATQPTVREHAVTENSTTTENQNLSTTSDYPRPYSEKRSNAHHPDIATMHEHKTTIENNKLTLNGSSRESSYQNDTRTAIKKRKATTGRATNDLPGESAATKASNTIATLDPQDKKDNAVHQPAVETNAVAAAGKTPSKEDVKAPQTGTSQAETKSEQKRIITTTPKKHVYIGVIGAPDISTVKFEKFSQVGFEAGIILGYEFSKKLSIEAGAFSDKKFYYSEGEYVNSSKMYLPANTKIISMDGYCRMIEIPVVVKYNVLTKGEHALYAAAGVSSYLMKHEDYNYNYLYVTSSTTATHNKVYDNATKNWVSVLQLSAGYSHKLGKIGDFRVEPYYKIPLKGLGYGELPISSLGIHFGITKKLF
jgi:hypothetical protein